MRRLLVAAILTICFLAGAGVPTAAAAQQEDKSIMPGGVIGVAAAVSASEITIKTDAGNTVTASLNAQTTYMRLPPGETTLSKATKITAAEVAAGDRVFARGLLSADQKTLPARVVIVMTKADIAQKQERDRAEWQRRGIAGTVSAINPASKEVTVNIRAREGDAPVNIAAGGEAVRFRRYAPGSVKFSDAQPGTFADLRVGDQVRALGERSADGASFTPEEIVSGSFRTIGGTVTAVNPAANEVKIKELNAQGKAGELSVTVNQDSMVRRLPPEMATMLAQRMAGGRGEGRPRPGAGGSSPSAGSGNRPGAEGGGPPQRQRPPADGAGGPPSGNPGGQGGNAGGPPRGPRGGVGGNIDLQEMLERMPASSLADLKPGDVVLFSSTTGADPTKATAITMVAGLDPIVKMMQQSGSRRGGGAGNGAEVSGNLPGLDLGIGLP